MIFFRQGDVSLIGDHKFERGPQEQQNSCLKHVVLRRQGCHIIDEKD